MKTMIVATIIMAMAATVLAMDGCPLGFQYRCGHLCLWNGGVCQCGGTNLTDGDIDTTQCCADTGCTITSQDSYGTVRSVSCPTGSVSLLTDGCPVPGDGRCTYHPGDNNRDYRDFFGDVFRRSYFPCNRSCVREHDLCRGKSVCGPDDMSDLRLCEADNRTCPRRDEVLLTHGQCVVPHLVNDGNYDTWDRSDERRDTASSNSSSGVSGEKNYTSLHPDCNTSDSVGYPGLYCEGDDGRVTDNCLPSDNWCRGENIDCRDSSGQNRTTDNYELCRDTASFRHRPCPQYVSYSASDRYIQYYRCTGSWPGQCLHKEYVCDGDIIPDSNTWSNGIAIKYCRDGSDEVCPASTCSSGG